jgi:hypothetical protein
MLGIVILLVLCLGSVWAAHFYIKVMMEEYKKEHESKGPTKHPQEYIGPEDEPEWKVYSYRIGRWY